MRSTVAAAAFVGLGVFAPGEAWAQCVVGATTVTCADTTTTDTTFPANPQVDRAYQGLLAVPIDVTIDNGASINGDGLAFTNIGTGGVTVNNGGTISVDAGNTPTAGGTAALAVTAAGGPIVYTGGDIVNNGNGDAFDARQTGGSGSVSITAGTIFSAAGQGVTVRDVAGSTGISVTTGAVTAMTAGKDGIDAQSQSLTGNITEVVNGDINAGNAGMVGAILNAAATGSVNVTANGSIDARFGVDAENFGSGNTFVTTVGPVNVTNGNGIFALATGGHVIVNAGDVTSTSNTAIIAQQTKVAGAGLVGVTAGNVSGTTGIDVHNFGTGDIGIVANGTVTGTAAEGIKAIGNAGVFVSVANTVTGATRGLSLIGGTGGGGAIFVTGTGGFVGGSDDAVNIKNNGSGGVTVDISGASSSTGGNGFLIRDTATGGNISVTTGAVTALNAGKDAIDVQTQSTTASITEVANGDINAGNAGMVAAILSAAGTGNVDVTANGAMTARFGVDAENFGSGSTSVTTVGPVNVTNGNGIFALATGGDVVVNAGDVTSTGNTAIVAQQNKVAGTGAVIVGTIGNVSGTTGIDAHNAGTGLTAVVAGGTVTGTAFEGIKAVGNAGVIVTAFDTVTGATRGLSLTGGTGGAGDILVNGPGGFVGGSDDAANIKNNGSGTVTVALGGASSSTGGNGFLIRDTATGGDISVTTGAITALNAAKDAIDVQTQSLTANVTEVVNGDINAGNAGMVGAILNAAATGSVNVTANGSIDARFGVDAENFGSGSTTVTTVGPVNATSGNGIFALTTGGNDFVFAGDVTSTGNTAIIAQQTKVAGAGGVGVSAGNVSGTTGIDAHNFGTGGIGIVANGTVTGTTAEGIKATGNGAVTMTVADTVTGATRGLSLIGGTLGTGDISVTGAGGFVGGSDDAANIKNNGAGTVTVDISGASSSTGGNGFFVRDTGIGGDISITTGSVTALTANKNAVDVITSSTAADVTEVANGDINAGNAGMVGAIVNAAATGEVSVTAKGSLTARFGIDAENFGSGNTLVTTVGPVTATSGNGIFALSTGGHVVVTAGDVTSTGNIAIVAHQNKVAGAGLVGVNAGNVSGTTGIDANNAGTGDIGINTIGTVTGTLAEGINAVGNANVFVTVGNTVTGATRGLSLTGGTGGTGDISVTGAGGFVGGTGDAANIKNNGSGTVTVDVSGASSSTGGNGFFVRDTGIGGDISVTTGSVTALTANKNAVDVITSSTTANVTEVANGDINAGNAGMVAAVVNAAATGNVDVTANGAMTARFGVDAENFGSGSTSVTTVGPVNVTSGNGIFASTAGGAITVTAGDVTSTGNTAILAQQTNVAGSGGIAVSAGNVSGTTGIDAHNLGTGIVGVNVTNGTVTGTAAEGIKAIGNAGVFVGVNDTVTGATRGLSLIGGSGGTGNISVAGLGGFVGGTGDGVNILNNGSGGVTFSMLGASSSAGGNGIFVRDTPAGGNIFVKTGAVTALTAGKNAIDVITQSTTANVIEIANGDVQGGNAGMVAAIIPAAATGNINVTANGAMTARFGIDAENFGSGNTLVTTVGPVTATSGNGIFALSTGGNVVVDAGDVTSTDNTAIIAQQTNAAGAGLVDVTARNVSGTTGIDARNLGTGKIGIVTGGTVTGTVAEGIKAIGNNGVIVRVDQAVTGATLGLSLVGGTGGTGDIFVFGTGGFFGGTGDGANIQNNGAGTVTVDISGASGSTGGNGIVVGDTAIGGDINVTTGAVTALTAGKNAIDVITNSTTANVTEVANGDVQAGNGGMVAAIVPAAATGNVDVTANGAITARFGVDAENFGGGSTSVTTVGPVNVTSGNGIFARSVGGNVGVTSGDVTSTGNIAVLAQQTNIAGAGNIDVTAGNVSGTNGVVALNSGTGAIGVTTSGTVTGTAGDGIKAIGNDAVTISAASAVTGSLRGLTVTGGSGGAGNISVTGTGGFFGGTGDGAHIQNNGSGTVTVDISGASGSTAGNGITVGDTAIGGDISVTTGAVTALAGGFNGINVIGASNTGNVAVVANGAVRGGNAGIVAGLISTSTGNVDVTANGAVSGKFGVDAENYGTGNVTVKTIGPVTATTGYGVVGLTEGGNVTVTTGAVSSTGAGAILAEQINSAAAGSVGVTAGNVSGTRGIIAQTYGSGGVSVNALGNVTATNGNGIEALNLNPAANAGTINVAQAAGTKITATNGAGIYANSGLSTGLTTITVAGEITAGTPGFAGVYGTSTTGGITVNVTGTGKIDPDYGIDLSTVNGPLVVNNAGLVTGAIDGVRLVATGTGTANITNTGTITGGTNAVVISVNNTPSTLSNTGTINGAIKMIGTPVATSNWINAATGIANLGTGTSSISGNLVNGGNVNLGAGGTLTVLGNTQNAGRVSFAGAGSFTTVGALANSGIINAQNNLSGNVVTVGGNYTGGGQFFADYSPSTVTADRLNIGGTASGNTNVTMNLAGARAYVPGGFLPVVTVVPGAAANAFTSNTVFATSGFILESFGRNPATNTQFGVIQTVNLRAMGLGSLSYMAESASGLLDDPISPFVTNRTDAGGTRFSLWMRGSGGHSTQTINSSLTGAGLSFASSTRFRSDQHAAQIGGDVSFGGIGGGWKVNVGVMGGWYGASAPLAGGERIKVETPFIGGYAVVGNGAFELEGNIRKEWRHYRLAMPSLFGTVGTRRLDGDATAGSVRASYRIGTRIGFAATPFAAFSYGDTKIDPLAIDAFSVWTPGSDTTKIGQAGLRLSYRGGSEATATFEPFISAARMENWSRGDSSSFAFGTPVTSFSLQTSSWKDAMRYSAGILANAHGGRVSAFVVGNIDDDSRLRSFTIHAGLRFNF